MSRLNSVVVMLVLLAVLVHIGDAAFFSTPLSMSEPYHPSRADTIAFLGHDSSLRGSSYFTDMRARLIKAVMGFTSKATQQEGLQYDDDATDYPYWRCIPNYIFNIKPNVVMTYSAPCWQNTQMLLTRNGDGNYTITVTVSDQSKLFCSDFYLFGTLEGVMTQTFIFGGKNDLVWTVAPDITKAEQWDIETNGVRVFMFLYDELTITSLLSQTVALFDPLLTEGVSDAAAKINVDFMAKYPQVPMPQRSTEEVGIDPSMVHSGDFFGIIRLDGLDPMLAWAMGAHTGHTTVALWMDGELYITESTTKGSYWPVDGIQRTPWATWLAQAKAAGYNVVHAPLSAAAREQFNETAAIEYFYSVQGYGYGYQNLLWAWLDTTTQNYPCIPPRYDMCLTIEHQNLLFGFLDRAEPDIGSILYRQAYNIRLGLPLNTPFAESLMVANTTFKLPLYEIGVITEMDGFRYNTTRYGEYTMGPAMVCCVYVCNIWKSAGLFKNISNSFNCAEQTNYDLYSLNVLDVLSPRPQQCINADPKNQLCQLEGKYELTLQDYGTRTPYKWMDERCPSSAPNYTRPSDC